MSPAAMPLWVAIPVAVLVAIGGVGGLVALLNLGRTRQKMDVDAAKVVTEAATALVAPLSTQVLANKGEMEAMKTAHTTEMAAVRSEVRLLREDLEAWDATADEHHPWDVIVAHELKRAGIEVPPMPPVRPKRRRPATGPIQTVTVTVETPSAS